MNVQEQINVQAERTKGCGYGYRWRTGENVDALPKDTMTMPIKYACPICNELYDTEIEAMACRDEPYDDAGFIIGDIVIIPGLNLYQPPNEDYKHWCAFEIEGSPGARSHFDHNKQWFPYYVITAIHPHDRDRHRCVVTVMTMFHGELCGGWNPANGNGHYSLYYPGRTRREQPKENNWYRWNLRRHGKTFGNRIASAKIKAKLLIDARELARIGISTENLL